MIGHLAGDDQLAADLAERRGHPDLVLALQPELGGDLAAELAGREHPGGVPDLDAQQLAVVTAAGPARRRRRGARPPREQRRGDDQRVPAGQARAGRRMFHRLLSPSECSTTAAPGGSA